MRNVYSTSQEDLLQLGSKLSRMLKQRFGKGPETCFVSLHSNRLTIYVRNFITPAEEVLIERGQPQLAIKFRSTVMEKVFQQFMEVASDTLDLPFTTYYNDWDYETNTGILFVEDKCSYANWEDSKPLTGKLLEQISRISSAAHKMPNEVNFIRINQNIMAIQFEGVMLQTERVLFNKGYHDLLLDRSIEIKNTYVEYKSTFELLLGRNVDSIFMTWDYVHDQCYIFFYLQ